MISSNFFPSYTFGDTCRCEFVCVCVSASLLLLWRCWVGLAQNLQTWLRWGNVLCHFMYACINLVNYEGYSDTRLVEHWSHSHTHARTHTLSYILWNKIFAHTHSHTLLVLHTKDHQGFPYAHKLCNNQPRSTRSVCRQTCINKFAAKEKKMMPKEDKKKEAKCQL